LLSDVEFGNLMQQNGHSLCLLFNQRSVCVSDDLYFESILVPLWLVD